MQSNKSIFETSVICINIELVWEPLRWLHFKDPGLVWVVLRLTRKAAQKQYSKRSYQSGIQQASLAATTTKKHTKNPLNSGILWVSLRLSFNLVKLNTRIVWVSLRLYFNLVKFNTRIVWVSLRLSLNLVKLNTRIVWVSLHLSFNLVKLNTRIVWVSLPCPSI